MGADADFLGRMGPELQLLLPMLDERARRLVLGMTARAAGEGGTGAVATLTGASWQTVAKGAAELASGTASAAGPGPPAGAAAASRWPTPIRGCPARWGAGQGLVRGDPESPLVWTTNSVKRLAGQLTAQGHRCSDSTCCGC